MTDRLLTPEDLVARWSVPLKTLYSMNYRRTGPPALKIGKHLRWRKSDVLAWEQRQQVAR